MPSKTKYQFNINEVINRGTSPIILYNPIGFLTGSNKSEVYQKDNFTQLFNPTITVVLPKQQQCILKMP